MREKSFALLVAVIAFLLPACSQSEDLLPEDAMFPFERYDIMMSINAAQDDMAGRIKFTEGSDPWRSGDIIYLERDGLFVYRDKQGNFSRNWGYAAHYGKYNPKGVRPIPGQQYYCIQTGSHYIADESGRLLPKDTPETEVKVTTWNIGGFNNGNSGDFKVDSEEKYHEILGRFDPIIKEIDSDLIGLCEFLPSIFNHSKISEDLMGAYPYQAISEVYGDYTGKAFYSRIPIANPRLLRINHSIAMEVDAVIGGRVFKVCICHPVWWKTDDDPNFQTLRSLAERYKYVERVILMGDFNILRERVDESLLLFAKSGFSRANMGEFGTLITSYNTHYSTPALDNIFVKGAEITSVQTVQCTPAGLDALNPEIKDELLWDAVNPSDHFPLSATLLIK